MSISLTPDLHQWIQAKIQTGLYASPNEVIREALELLEARDRLRQIQTEELRKQIAIGVEQLDRGEGRSLGQQTLERIRAEAKERLAGSSTASE